MKVKGILNKLHRINPNGVMCDKGSLDKLKEGESVELPKEAAEELLNMGFVTKTKQKKEAK